MRATFNATTKDERVETYEGTFDHTGVGDGWADLIIVAQVSVQKKFRKLNGTGERVAVY